MTRIKLDGLMYSTDDYLAIRDWAQTNQRRFDVNMPSGIAFAPLTRIIYVTDILNSDTDGVLIADHTKYSDEQIRRVIRQLEYQSKWLFAVSNGLEPLPTANKSQGKEHARFADTPILKILDECRPALRWLNEEGPTQVVPGKYTAPVKKLENLGFIYKRNNKTFSLRRHRLRKVLKHESKKLTAPYRLEDLLYT